MSMTTADYREARWLERQKAEGHIPERLLIAERELQVAEWIGDIDTLSEWICGQAEESVTEFAVVRFAIAYALDPAAAISAAKTAVLVTVALSERDPGLRIAAIDEVRRRYIEYRENPA